MAIRLINTDTLQLKSFTGDRIPKYAILSHTWEHDGEVSFQEMTAINDRACNPTASTPGYRKIVGTCEKARSQGIAYAWVDTCCIDKTSSSELSEAINSMYRWYEKADLCYALLSDYDIGISTPHTASSETALTRCRWFSRGWCLQELIAPRNLVFFDAKWNYIGSKVELSTLISKVTHVNEEVLIDSSLIRTIPVARRLSWAAERRTNREEDMAYCLLGVPDINMPMLYGEGVKAFTRLQEELVKASNDLSIFAFLHSSINHDARPSPNLLQTFCDLFATSPRDFLTCRELVHAKTGIQWNDSFALTNRGLYFRRVKLNIDYQHGLYRMALNCETPGSTSDIMYLRKIGPSLYARWNHVYLPDSAEHLDQRSYGDDSYTMIEEDAYILTSISPAIQLQLGEADEYAIRVLSHRHDLSMALQIVQRATSSDRWDISRMQFLTAGKRSIVGFWKVFPRLLGTQDNTQDAFQFPSGPVYLVCGIKHDDHAPHPAPWVHLYSLEEWRDFERDCGIVTDLNDAAGFARTSNTTSEMIISGRDSRGRRSISANIQLVVERDRKRFELELLFEEKPHL